jgi:hypothetical protein
MCGSRTTSEKQDSTSATDRALLLRIAGAIFVGSFLMVLIVLPAFAEENGSSSSPAYDIALLVVFTSVGAFTYRVARRGRRSKSWAVLTAVIVPITSFALPIVLVWAIVQFSGS